MIVVTGAAGVMGRQVLQRLVDEGTEVLGTDKVAFDDSPAPTFRPTCAIRIRRAKC